jgi:hypothetical protein
VKSPVFASYYFRVAPSSVALAGFQQLLRQLLFLLENSIGRVRCWMIFSAMSVSFCSPCDVDAVIHDIFHVPLTEAGFQKPTRLKYVRSRFEEMRDVIEFRSDRGSLIFVWGFSLNFVPHIAGRNTETVAWHRTPNSANADLRYSGLGRFCSGPIEPGATISIYATEPSVRDGAELTRQFMLPKALAKLDSVRQLRNIEALFEEEERNASSHFFNFPQLALAYAFYLAKVGDQRARQYMSEWLEHSMDRREETLDRITKLFEEAVNTPFNP